MNRHRFLGLLSGVALIAVGCRNTPGRVSPPAAGPVEVGVVTMRAERVVLTTELPGRTAAYLVAEVRPQVNGIIQARKFVEGSTVQAASLLYQIDPAPYQAAFDQAKAALAVAEAAVPPLKLRTERLKELVAIRAVGQQEYDEASAALQKAEASVSLAKAAVESARINLAYTPLRAPITGRTGKSLVTPGALVTAYQPTPLVTIQQLDPIYVDVTQSSADLLRLRRNLASGKLTRSGPVESQVKLVLEDGTRYAREGTLQFRDITVDPTTGSVVLRMVFPNPDSVLLPGMFVRAIVEEGVLERAVLAPQPGVTRDVKGNTSVMLVDDSGKVAVRPIVVERAIGDRWLVTSGLSDGDRVVVDGLQRIRAGLAVKPVPFASAEPTTGRTPAVVPAKSTPAAPAK